MATVNEAVERMEWKRARVSQKRQVTIPQKLFEQAGIKDEVEFGIKGNHIIMRPVREHTGSDYFADLILADLIKEGYTGEQLLAKFREKQAELQVAVQQLIAESADVARSYRGTGEDETKKLFGDVIED
ncbi:AbrB/MazE/SpoVT family DNA-binding domain-containing protein [Paenibacillus sp. YYML68]|uniref:AbrB/MazE/SpoVT family DNA-binding domain-containing protein n=1 Tax=Paenibacillus sp. YYML68 TaxID=2909250 RepID=UPI002493C137|nr:AbrB/MazE/SpoVT family DNA-binding domain-containing protein [Paenibacillus sp. YYML68]